MSFVESVQAQQISWLFHAKSHRCIAEHSVYALGARVCGERLYFPVHLHLELALVGTKTCHGTARPGDDVWNEDFTDVRRLCPRPQEAKGST